MKLILLDSPEVRRELEEILDELAREYRETHDPKVKKKMASLSRRLATVRQTEEEDTDCE